MPVDCRCPLPALTAPRLPVLVPRLLRARSRSLAGATAVALALALLLTPLTAPAQGAPQPPSGQADTTASAKETSLGSLWSTRPGWDAPEPWRTDKWYFQFAYYTLHFSYDPDHQQSYLFDMEYRLDQRWLDGQWIVGLSLFQNSFGQFSQYLYGALQWRPLKEHQPFYVKLSAGLLHGYSGEYRDKIPLNHYEIAPAIIPSVGYCWTRYCTEFVLLGGNAALFTVGMTVP